MDLHACWKSNKRIKDSYTNKMILYVNSKITVAFCCGELIMCVHKDSSGIKDDSICTHLTTMMVAFGL